MPKYVCTVCGYTYDESNGIPEANITPGTAWVDLPKDWSCPLCGASKTEFTKQDDSTSPAVEMPMSVVEQSADMKEMSPLQISTLCLNLARGCEKQYKQEEATLFTELASYFNKLAAPAKDPNFDKLINLIEKDLTEGLPNANAVASDATDRGALRALVWCEKVTRILKSLLTRYQKLGDAMLENTGVYVCTICGFIYIGDNLPSVCPVCKVPNWKFEKI